MLCFLFKSTKLANVLTNFLILCALEFSLLWDNSFIHSSFIRLIRYLYKYNNLIRVRTFEQIGYVLVKANNTVWFWAHIYSKSISECHNSSSIKTFAHPKIFYIYIWEEEGFLNQSKGSFNELILVKNHHTSSYFLDRQILEKLNFKCCNIL